MAITKGDDPDDMDYRWTEESSQTDSFPSLKKKTTTRKTGAKEFKGLVALINHSSKSKGSTGGNDSNIENVLRRWSVLSKY